MNETQRKRRDFIQNIAIAALSVLAVLLFTQSQLFSLNSGDSGQSGSLTGSNTPISTAPLGQDTPLALPVRAAVTGPYGRYGSVTLSTSDEAFDPLRNLLEQALGSARSPTLCGTQAFQDALQSPSLYCDFLSALPLSVLANAVWTSSDLALQARYLILSGQGENTTLYLWDGANLCYRCDTALSCQELETAVNQYESGNTHFAFDLLGTAEALAPFSLLPDTVPDLPTLSASVSLADTNRLLTLLDFNPNTNYRYPESDGSETVVEGDRSVRIRPNGTVVYSSGGAAALTIKAQAESPTALEAAAGTSAFLNELLSGTASDAALYLTAVQQNGTSFTVTFDYQAGGVPIRFSDGKSAAEVTLNGTAISSMTLRFRQYTPTGTGSLLPLRQALAIAARQPGQELSIGYVDSGSAATASWLSDKI